MRDLSVLLVVLATTPAHAETQASPFAAKMLGAWEVYATAGDCWMKRVAPNGNEFLLSTAAEDADLYVVMRKKAWTFIKEDAELPMRVQFTGTDATRQGSGSVGEGDLTPGVVMFLNDSSRDYLADLRQSKVIRTWLAGKPAMTVSMAGARPALDYFGQCTAEVRRKKPD